MKNTIAMFALFLVTTFTGSGACANDTGKADLPGIMQVASYDPARDAQADIDAAIAAASTTGQFILMIVGGDWCTDCVRLDAFLKQHPDLAQAMAANFYTIKINLSSENRNKEVLSNYPEFSWVPNFCVLNADGSVAASIDTRTVMSDGKFDPALFKEFLQQWDPDAHKS